MNWLDVVLIAVVAVGAFKGMRTGLIGATITAIGVFIGWLLAGQLSDEAGELIGGSLSSDRWVTVITYIAIIGVAVLVASIVAKIVRPLLSVATLGISSMIDRLGGLALGALLGLGISGALIIVMARLAYNFELPEEGIAGEFVERIPHVEETQKRTEDALTGSIIVPRFVDITDALPASALGFVPSDFKASLDILEENIDEEGSS